MFKWMIPLEQHIIIRTSFLKTFQRCPAQAMFRYFRGIIAPPGSAATVGSCTHTSAEYQNKYKLKKGRDAKLSVLQDVFNEDWKKRSKKTKWIAKEKPDTIKTHSIKKLLPVYHEKVGKKVEPLFVEKPFSIEIPEVNATLTGKIDLVEVNKLIRDLKTKSRTPNWSDILKSNQCPSYSLGFESIFGEPPSGFILDYLIRTNAPKYIPSKKRVVKPYETLEYIKLVQMIVMNIRQGLFYPNRDGNNLCTTKWCGYWHACYKGAWMNTPKDGRIFMGNDGQETTVEEGEA